MNNKSKHVSCMCMYHLFFLFYFEVFQSSFSLFPRRRNILLVRNICSCKCATPMSQTLSRARYTSVVVSWKLAMRQVENDVGGHAFLGNSSILPFVTVVRNVFGLIRAQKGKNRLNRSMDILEAWLASKMFRIKLIITIMTRLWTQI